MRQLLIAFCILSLCAVFSPAMAAEEVTFTGKVTRVDLEGGFWGIVAQDGTKYDPMNLAPEFHKDGMAVAVKGVLRNDVMSMRMWGKILEIKKIKALVVPAGPAGPADEADPNMIILIICRDKGSVAWSVDKEGNYNCFYVTRMGRRPSWDIKLMDTQVAEIKKNLESVKWAELKENYPAPQAKAVDGEKAPLEIGYKVVVMVDGKPQTTTIINPGANDSVPEGLTKAVKMIIEMVPKQR